MRQDPVSHYGYINAKLRAKIGLMRERQIVSTLLKSESLVDAVAVLRSSAYHQVAESYDKTGDLQHMELVLLTLEIAMYRDVAKHLEGKSAVLVEHLLGKIEVDNLKNALRLWYSSIIRNQSIRHRSEYLFKQRILHQVDWVALINATSYEAVCKALKDTVYEQTVASFSLSRLQQEGLFALESELDKNWYLQLMECTRNLGKTDREIATDVFLFEIDLKNILTLVRYFWYHQMESEDVKNLLIPLGKVYDSKLVASYLKQKETERDPQSLMDAFLSDIEDASELNKRGSVPADQTEVLQTLKIEAALNKQRKKMYQKMLTSDPFSIALPLAYFFLFKEETRMIRAVLNGKYYGYDEQYIKGVLG